MTADGEEQQESASETEEDDVQRRSEASVSQPRGLYFKLFPEQFYYYLTVVVRSLHPLLIMDMTVMVIWGF